MPSSVSTTTIAVLRLTTVPRSLVYCYSFGIGAVSSIARTSVIFIDSSLKPPGDGSGGRQAPPAGSALLR